MELVLKKILLYIVLILSVVGAVVLIVLRLRSEPAVGEDVAADVREKIQVTDVEIKLRQQVVSAKADSCRGRLAVIQAISDGKERRKKLADLLNELSK